MSESNRETTRNNAKQREAYLIDSFNLLLIVKIFCVNLWVLCEMIGWDGKEKRLPGFTAGQPHSFYKLYKLKMFLLLAIGF